MPVATTRPTTAPAADAKNGGGAADAAAEPPGKDAFTKWEPVSSAFGHWMVWCQTCRHGGHAEHMSEWFKHHDECPVSGCNCRCSKLT